MGTSSRSIVHLINHRSKKIPGDVSLSPRRDGDHRKATRADVTRRCLGCDALDANACEPGLAESPSTERSGSADPASAGLSGSLQTAGPAWPGPGTAHGARPALPRLLSGRRSGPLLASPARPCANCRVPASWPELRIEYRHRGAVYEVLVERPHAARSGDQQVVLDGHVIEGEWIPLVDDGTRHTVVISPLSH